MRKLLLLIIGIMLVFPVMADDFYKYEPIKLSKGWNGIGIIPYYENLTTRSINYSLTNDSSTGRFNLLGFSAMRNCKPITSLKFYNSNGEEKSYNDAVADNWIDEIKFTNLSGGTEGEIEKYNKICPYEAYWIKSYEAVNISYKGVYGSPHENFNWSKLRFYNGSLELNITEAANATYGWWSPYIQYWDTDENYFRYVCMDTYANDPINYSPYCLAKSLDSWKGYFIYSNYDNIYLLTNNETEPTHFRPKVLNNEGKNRFRPKIENNNGKSRFRWAIALSHIIRLIGDLRERIG